MLYYTTMKRIHNWTAPSFPNFVSHVVNSLGIKKSVMCTVDIYRGFASSSVLNSPIINPQDGYNLDNTQAIADEFMGNKEGAHHYFKEKAESIRSAAERDLETAYADGIPQEETDGWKERVRTLAEDLENQVEDVLDLAGILDTPTSSDDEESGDESSEDESNNTSQGVEESTSQEVDGVTSSPETAEDLNSYSSICKTIVETFLDLF